jgi:hypothetical protein
MTRYRKHGWKLLAVLGTTIIFILAACGNSPDPESTPTPTNSGGSGPLPTSTSRCQDLSGEIEMQVLVGPSDAVGLEPVAIGQVPFTVASAEGVYLVQGSGSIFYEDLLEKEWGTYSVYFNQDAALSGECLADESSGELKITLETNGEQMVEIRSEGFQGDYPWSGTHQFDLNFPITDGASAAGEGWTFILHLAE